MTTRNYMHYINGSFVPAASGEIFETSDPYSGRVWATIARGSSADVDAAVTAAKNALDGEWGTYNASQRGKLLNRLAELIERDATRLAEIEVRDNGKLMAEMSVQTKYMAEWYRYYGSLADKIQGAVIPTDKADTFNYTRYEPLGVVAMITPWNSPLLLLTWKLAPALAAGNTAVIKPSEFTSASTITFMELFEEAGFPAGVVNTVAGFGEEVGAPLVSHKDVAKVAFTGSDYSGQKIYESAAKDIKNVTLELGGKSPAIIAEDVDVGEVVDTLADGASGFLGQVCVSLSRVLAPRSRYDEIVEALALRYSALKIGDPFDSATDRGPLAVERARDRVEHYVALALEQGAQIVTGGRRPPDLDRGWYYQPTLLTAVNNQMTVAREEIFGPVTVVIPYEGIDEAVQIANDSPFGLAASVYTKDADLAMRVARQIRAGSVAINMAGVSLTQPFGGYKQSGWGRECGPEGILEFTQIKQVLLGGSYLGDL